MLTDAHRERLLRVTAALHAVRAELHNGAPTLETVQSLGVELKRLDNTVERATARHAEAPELAAFHDLRIAVMDLGRDVALTLRMPIAEDLLAMVAMLSEMVPLVWNATGDGVVRWLTRSALVLGPCTFLVENLRRSGRVRRVLRPDLLWLELSDEIFVSFEMEDAPLAALISALAELGVPFEPDAARAQMATGRLVEDCERHVAALESLERNFGRKPNVGALIAQFKTLTALRLDVLAHQSAMLGNAGADLHADLVEARAVARQSVLQALHALGEPSVGVGDFPELYARLEPHLPFFHADFRRTTPEAQRLIVSQRVLCIGPQVWPLSDIERVDVGPPAFTNAVTVVTSKGQALASVAAWTVDVLHRALSRAGVIVRTKA